MVGLDNAGKTTVLYKLKARERGWVDGRCAAAVRGVQGGVRIGLRTTTSLCCAVPTPLQLGENISTVPTIGARTCLCCCCDAAAQCASSACMAAPGCQLAEMPCKQRCGQRCSHVSLLNPAPI